MIVAGELGRAPARDVRAGDSARGRPRGDPAPALARGRGPVHRRDPPDGAARGRDALPCDGGLPRRRRRRQGRRCLLHPAEPASVHGRGRHDAVGLLPAPLRDRFGFTAHLDFYSADELERIIERAARLLGFPVDADGRARSRDGREGRPASPTGCFGACATGPRSTATARDLSTARERARRLRGGRARTRSPRPRRARGALHAVRRRSRGSVDARGIRGRRDGDGRDGRRAVPRPRGAPEQDPPRAGRDPAAWEHLGLSSRGASRRRRGPAATDSRRAGGAGSTRVARTAWNRPGLFRADPSRRTTTVSTVTKAARKSLLWLRADHARADGRIACQVAHERARRRASASTCAGGTVIILRARRSTARTSITREQSDHRRHHPAQG